MLGVFSSRRWIIAIAALAWIALDAARSWNAHQAYSTPRELDAVRGYTDVAWPPGANLPADTPLGRRVFVERCAVCHGMEGRGDGPAAPMIRPRPGS